MPRDSPLPERCRSAKNRVLPAHRQSAAAIVQKPQAETLHKPAVGASLTAPCCAFAGSEILKNLHAMVIAVHYIHLVRAVNKEAHGQLKIAKTASLLAEVIKQLPFSIENLHRVIQALHDV